MFECRSESIQFVCVLLFSTYHHTHNQFILRRLFFIAHSYLFTCVDTCAYVCVCLHTCVNGCPVYGVSAFNSKVKPCELIQCVLNIIVGIFIYTQVITIYSFSLLSADRLNDSPHTTTQISMCVGHRSANERKKTLSDT